MVIHKFVVVFLLIALGLAAGQAAPAPVIIAIPGGARLRLEALDDSIIRCWFKPAGAEFRRDASLATDQAPSSRFPLRVSAAAGATVVETAALRFRIDPSTLAFDVSDRTTGAPLLTQAKVTMTPGGAWTLTHELAPAERLFGLGEDNVNQGRLDRRGTVRELWEGQKIASGNVTAEDPIPFLISTGRQGQAYGVFFDNVHRLRFDLGQTQSDQLHLDAAGGEVDFYVIGGPRIAQLIERYTRLTGRPSLPPLWALGYWQSKCSYYDWAGVDAAHEQLRARDFPLDVMVIDADWPEVVNNFQWAKRWFAGGAEPKTKIADYARDGVKIILSQSGPMVREDSPTFRSGWDRGVFATDGHGHPVECGYYAGKLLDFTAPQLDSWLWPQVAARIGDGVAAWWLDLDEPEGEPAQTRYVGGTPENVHNQFSLLCIRSFEGVQLQENPDRRPFILSRAGPAGMQSHHAAVWTGDIFSDYATLRAHPPEMLNIGMSGFPYWTCDTGGFLTGYYKNDQFGAHARLYERWMEFSAFSPITRAHKAGGLPEPYQFGPAVEQSTRHYLHLRYQLLPYIYSYAWEAAHTGLPLVRALALEYQDDPGALACPGDEYLFGRELLVAPVLNEGLTNRAVYFPPGRWFDWDTGVEYSGGRSQVVAAPQNRIPVAVRAGAIIPMAPYLNHTDAKAWDPITLEVFPSGRSEFTLYQDDGTTFGYTRGESTVTHVVSTELAGRVRLTLTASNRRFVPATYIARLHLGRAPGAVAIDGTAAGPGQWSWDSSARVLQVTIDAHQGTEHGVDVSLAGAVLAPRPAPELRADVIDLKAEANGSVGQPLPNFFPPPALPTRIKAINYDKGGEGIAFHSDRPAPPHPRYRPDDFSLAAANDSGGGDVLGGLQAGEWMRYTIDCGNGGFFDLSLRVASASGAGRFQVIALDRVLAAVDVPATGGDEAWKDLTVPGVYLNPGQLTLMVLVDRPGFLLNTLNFQRARTFPTRYSAIEASRAGVADVLAGGGSAGKGAIRNLGREGSSLTWGVVAAQPGAQLLRFHFQNGTGKPLPYNLQVGDAAPQALTLPTTSGAWQDFDVTVPLAAGANRVALLGKVDGWDSVTLESLTVLPPGSK